MVTLFVNCVQFYYNNMFVITKWSSLYEGLLLRIKQIYAWSFSVQKFSVTIIYKNTQTKIIIIILKHQAWVAWFKVSLSFSTF